ncbi:hypothetical protein OUZ56_026042 [Daphnia magna]|uniref:Uncharacterized protein n=1 Tax=Daphnia magna TaxID=35525 RepID=A0ABQ9ZKQ0_9CRUS|nr:hypothetical protein OUZ56_026042 [Daphnia magna]
MGGPAISVATPVFYYSATIEIFDHFENLQLSIRSWSILPISVRIIIAPAKEEVSDCEKL